MPIEIERKFRVLADPDPAIVGPGVRLRQGYVAIDGTAEVRVRITDAEATLTVKGGTGRSRTEVEVTIPPAAAEELWALSAGRRLEKVRHRIDLGDGLTAELDRYHGELAGIVVVEVELPSEDRADAFVPPGWFGEELTGQAGWSNAALARDGAPG